MMRKYYTRIILLLCLLFATNAYAVSLVIRMSGGDSSTCDTSNIVFWWRCETTTLDATYDYSAASGTPTINGSLVVSEAAAKYGTYGIDFDAAWEHLYYATPSATLDDDFRWGAWVRITTWLNGFLLFQIYGDSSNNCRLILTGDDELTLYWYDTGAERTTWTTTDANLTTGTWYWIEAAAKPSTNYREIWVDGVSKGSSSGAINTFATAVATIYMGDLIGSSVDVHMDNIIISTDSTDSFTDCKDELEWPG